MKKIVFTFGRMNPPTIGHEKLANKIKDVARKEKADARIYLSHTNKPNTDPLSYNDKIKFAKKAFGIAYKSNAKQIFQIAKELFGQGYTDVIMVVGSDRVDEFQTILNKYNDKGDYNFDSIKVVSAGQRDPDAKGVEGMSGTKLRNLARDGDQETFMKGLASKLSPVDKKKVYALVAKNMTEEVELDEKVGRTALKLAKALVKTKGGNIRGTGLAKLEKEKAKTASLERKLDKALAGERIKKEKEKQDKINKNIQNAKQGKPQEESVDEAVLNIQQRKARARLMKKLAPKMARARKMKAKRMADPNQLKVRAQKAAIAIVRKKVAGDKGVNYANLSPNDKINVDKQVQKKSALIQKLAKKQLPKIRKAEQERLKALRGGSQNESVAQDQDIEDRKGTQPKKYYSGVKKSTKDDRDRAFKSGAKKDSNDPSAYPDSHPGDKGAKTKTSKHTKKYHQMYGEQFNISEDSENPLRKNSKASGISYGILKKVFVRGMAAWRTGH